MHIRSSSTIPTRNDGIAIPPSAAIMIVLSIQVSFRSALITPINIPDASHSTPAPIAMEALTGSRCSISVVTGSLLW